LNSAATTKMENMNFTLSNGVEAVATHNGTRFVEHMVSTTFDVTGSLNLEFNDLVQLRRFWGDAAATSPENTVLGNDLLIAWTTTDQIGSSGQYYTFELYIPEAVYSTGEPSVSSANDRIIQTLDFEGIEDGTLNYSARIRITNSESSYS